jgi:hypothetical protein
MHVRRHALALALALLPCVAFADARREAREAYDRGVAAYRRGDFAGAARAFAEADRLAPSSVALGAALDAAVKADDPLLGAELLERARRAPDDTQLAAKTQEARAKLGGRAGRLVIVCDGCTATLDGRATAPHEDLWVKAGPHVVVLRMDGVEHTLTVDVRADATTEAKPPPSPAPPPPTAEAPASAPASTPGPSATAGPEVTPASTGARSPAGRSGISPWFFAGSLALTVGAATAAAVTGGFTASRHDDFVQNGCQSAAPPTDCATQAAEGTTLQAVVAGLAIATGALAATTVVLAFFTQWKKPTMQAAIGPAGAWISVRGSF